MKLFLNLLFLNLLFFYSCTEKTEVTSLENSRVLYSSGAEYLKGDMLTDSVSFSEFNGVSYRTDEYSRTGKYGVKLDSNHLYGFNLEITNPKIGELYTGTVWQKADGVHGGLYCSVRSDNKSLMMSSTKSFEIHNGWVKHNISVVVTKGVDKLIFYVGAGGKVAYFDDVTVLRYDEVPTPTSSRMLTLFIPEVSNDKLEKYMESALEDGIISPENKSYVNGFILSDFDSIPIEIRLKGDWVDHLTSGKPSYRIKVKGDFSFNGLKTFSIQHPKTRNFLNEWFMHEWCKSEGILATSYDFLSVTFNDERMGVYALEEHFDKQLLEQKNRREGVLLKFDETGFWDLSLLKEDNDKSYPYYQQSFISLFKKKRTLKNKALKNQFIDGSKALNLLKEMDARVDEFMDVKQVAKYYAILEMGCAFHANNWHNRRFYFNPITQDLENVGFDMLAGEEPEHELSIIYGLNTTRNSLREGRLDARLYKNSKFRKYYMEYIERFSDSTYLNNLFNELGVELSIKEDLLCKEFVGNELDKSFYYKRGKFVTKRMNYIIAQWNDYMKVPFADIQMKKDTYVEHESDFYLESVSINAYVHKIDSAKYRIELENYHLNDVKIVGYKMKNDTIVKFETPFNLKGFKEGTNLGTVDVDVKNKPKSILFVLNNKPKHVLTKKLLKWKKPKGVTSKMKLANSFSEKSAFFNIIGSELVFNTGEIIIDKLLFIPSEFKVRLLKGTEINFIDGGGLIVNNDFIANGTEQEPILITSTDKNNHGITILKASSVEMNYVEFTNLNALHYKKWNLTGGVTIYESETIINNCKINANICEDGLNIIRSNFSIDSLTVMNTKSDGFDADFCTGVIKNSYFESTGNDCIDFSGSTIKIVNIDILNSGDKGISGGEASSLDIENISVTGAITGIASKDGSVIKGHDVKVVDAEYGLAVFRKKPEYKGASIELDSFEFSKLKEQGIVELGSFVKLNGEYFYGYRKLDIDALYSRFEKK
jgi:hypothetical protein